MKKYFVMLTFGLVASFLLFGNGSIADADIQSEWTDNIVTVEDLSAEAKAQISEQGYDLSDPNLVIHDLTNQREILDEKTNNIATRSLWTTVERAHYEKMKYPSLSLVKRYNYRYKTLYFRNGYYWYNSYGVEVKKESNNTIIILDIIQVYFFPFAIH